MCGRPSEAPRSRGGAKRVTRQAVSVRLGAVAGGREDRGGVVGEVAGEERDLGAGVERAAADDVDGAAVARHRVLDGGAEARDR